MPMIVCAAKRDEIPLDVAKTNFRLDFSRKLHLNSSILEEIEIKSSKKPGEKSPVIYTNNLRSWASSMR